MGCRATPRWEYSCLQEKTNYKSILYKTYFVMEYAVANYDVRFVLKTDDDAFINVRPLINQLKLLCETKDCKSERIYMVRTHASGEGPREEQMLVALRPFPCQFIPMTAPSGCHNRQCM